MMKNNKKENKKFLIIGNQNAITYKEIFPYIKENKLWLGLTMNGSNRWFEVPPTYEANENAAGYKVVDGKRMLFVNGVTWFTNIENNKRNQPYQFEILGLMSGAKDNTLVNGNDGRAKFYINNKGVYARICIKKVSYYDNNVELIEDDEK